MKKLVLIFIFLWVQISVSQVVNIPDANFKNALIQRGFDTNNDGEIQVSEAEAVTHLAIDGASITSLEGILSFTNVEFLDFANNNITTVNLHGLLKLQKITGYCSGVNSFTAYNLPKMERLDVYCNNLTTLDVSDLFNLEKLVCESNMITELDLSNLHNLRELNANVNQLETVNLKNSYIGGSMILSGNPTLRYICVDPEEQQLIQNTISNYGYTNCVVNSFCTFEPGGNVYYVEGNVKVDIDQDGCDSDDIGLSFLQLKVEDTEGNLGIFNTKSDGSYNIALPEGDYTIDYQFPYMSYFDVSPPSFSVNFPTDTSPFLQDICLTPNGNYNDLQIAIIPLEVARPGFDARYRIVYANVGTSILSGNVTFNYDDEIIDFISSSINPDIQNTGELSWSFSNMTPFDFTFIDVTMNLNAPTETPPLNGGETLCYEATISPITNDETVIDNSFSLKQTVVNSYDPNDKTCLEGDVITPDLVGEYVHYLIRFENTGSASAVNIVVKDIIDTNKFDMESFVPMSSSHDFVTRIQNDNEVEFIFEGINLPFDDANNDGFVMFKIKTLPSLVLGDTFENGAEIYFDFNFPIITNIEQTTIDTTASTDDFALNSNITVFPNPAENQLKIESRLAFDSVIIYDLTGKEIQRIVSTENRLTQELDVSKLKSGIYYLSIHSGNSKTTEKFLKI